MKVTLRRADALQRELGDYISANWPAHTRHITPYEQAKEVLERARLEYDAAMTVQRRAINAQYELRRLIGSENARLGTANLLNALAEADALIALHNRVASATKPLALQVIEGMVKRIATTTVNDWQDPIVNVTILTEEQIETARKEVARLKRNKVSLQAQLLEQNTQASVEISPDTEKLLLEIGLA